VKDSKIEWTDHTFNPWWGCTKVSPGCLNCYAETLDKRTGGNHWGKGAPRRRTSAANWRQPLKWQREAIKDEYDHDSDAWCRDEDFRWERPRVFCASMADWLDPEVPVEWLADLLDLIRQTPNLDWLLLTKRPGLWRDRLGDVYIHHMRSKTGFPGSPTDFESWIVNWRLCNKPPANVWIGSSVEDQTRADERIPQLLQIPARVRFLSCEPLLGPVDLDYQWTWGKVRKQDKSLMDAPRIDWVIVGGESGPKSRPMHADWARDLRDQCVAAGVSFFFKQWGEWAPGECVHRVTGPIEAADWFNDHWTHFKVYLQDPCHRDVEPDAYRVGKKEAGRLLDGNEWSQLPEATR
jgi:protein gp37